MKKLRVVVSLITQDNDFQIEQAAAAESAAAKLGVDVEILFADNDSIQQSQQILKFVQAETGRRPDGIIFEPVGGPALPQVARAAVAEDIAWVVMNRDLEYVKQLRQSYKVPCFSLGSDHLETGRIQGRQLAVLLPNGGSVLYIQGPTETDASKLRTAGMYETKPESIQVKTMKGNWTEASAFKAVTSWIRLSTSQQSHIDLIAAQNDAMAAGAKKALQEFVAEAAGRERWASIPFTGVDGVPKTGQAWVRSGVLTATVTLPPIAGKAMEMLVHALQSGTVPPELTLLAPHSYPELGALAQSAGKKSIGAKLAGS
ncbi:MAG TPA: sugar ABC transporter substrate-binding protein [Terriglobales bacterium]|nr:sugar ABC transporter substrate-binding protein [Terriglobales bacterium]